MKRYVVLGASAAGISGADMLRKLDKEAEILLISEETEIYSKCIMHYYMSGDKTKEQISFINKTFLKDNRICWKKGKRAVKINCTEKKVFLEDGEGVSYDKLLIATGSRGYLPPVKGLDNAENVCAFHTLGDCEIVLKKACTARNIVILGAGLVGVDAAYGLLHLKKRITMLDVNSHMMAVQLDQRAADIYEKEFDKRGVHQIYNTGIKEALKDDDGRIRELILTDGKTLPCDLLIIAAGTRANTELLEQTDLKRDQYGLLINEYSQTSDRSVYGAGDITGKNMVWPSAAKEAMTAAYHMTGTKFPMTDFFKGKATIHTFNIPTMAYGLPKAPDDSYTVEIKEKENGSYQKVIHKEGKIFGMILQGDLYFAGILNQLISTKADIRKLDKPVLELEYGDLIGSSREVGHI